jgi:hypothetical protein
MEGNELHPEVDSDGVHWFDEDEVDLVAKGGDSRPRVISARRRDASGPIDCRGESQAIAALSAIERRQRELDLQNAEQRATALASELDAAKVRIEELTEEQRKMRSITRMLGRLILDTFDQQTFRHFDSTLLAVIRACASSAD